jgi:hypothetical protein
MELGDLYLDMRIILKWTGFIRLTTGTNGGPQFFDSWSYSSHENPYLIFPGLEAGKF